MTTTTVFTARYISASAADDFVMTAVYHVTVRPDGEVILELDRVIAEECR